jgi:hypothetical protein
MDEADEIVPLEVVLHAGDRTVANQGLDAPQTRLEANAMFAGRPQLHL